MKLKFIAAPLLLALVMFSEKTYSQDFHLSQYDAATLYLNPALTGSYFLDKADYKIYANYRSQWKSVSSNPYSTSYLAFDMPQKRFGVGAFIINNHSGTGGFNTFNLMLSGSYQITDNEYGPHFLSVGLQAGLINKSFNPDKFTFDSQYSSSSGSGFDGTISSNESFTKTSIIKFDANLGVYYKYKAQTSKFYPFLGFSVFHLTMPNESFSDIKKRLPMRFVLNGGSDIVLNERLLLTPSILFMQQEKAHELNAGVLAYYNIKDTKYDVIAGVSHRTQDAIIIQCGLKHGSNIFRFGYDINTSYLNEFSGGKGAVEFSIIYTGRKKGTYSQF